jgi:hypothetical protein
MGMNEPEFLSRLDGTINNKKKYRDGPCNSTGKSLCTFFDWK